MGRLVELGLFVAAALFALHGFGLPRFGFPYEPGPRGDALRIVTWNVGDAMDASTAPAERFRVLLETLSVLDPSICILQEVSADVVDDLEQTLTGDPRTAFAGEDQRGCAVIVRRGRLVQIDVDDWRGREPIHALYRARGQPRVEIVGLHANAWSAVTRNLEIGRAVKLLESSDRRPALRVLAGDLNLDVALGGGKDLFTEDEYLDVQTYNYVAERFVDVAAGTGPTAEPDRRLDYVFLATEVTADVVAGVWTGRRAGGMDHHPVVVDITTKGR